MRSPRRFTIRTVIVPATLDPLLLDALRDVRSAVNHLIPVWRSHPEDSRFDATKRTYPWIRSHYPHLASAWAVSVANETSATLNSWDRQLRRFQRLDPTKWERLRHKTPRRTRLKVSLHRALYRSRGAILDITIHKDRHVSIDLAGVRHPLFERYGAASNWDFGLTVMDRGLVFQFRIPRTTTTAAESVGADVNMPSVDFATSDGRVGSVNLRPITAIQGAMERKRTSVKQSVPKDLRLQRKILRRYRGREHRRVEPLLHKAANEFLAEAGERNVVLEDLSDTQEQLMQETRSCDARRRLSRWTQGRFQRIVDYKAHTQIVYVNPRGTSSECPRCGGRLDHPVWRRSTCANCHGDWHRDGAAATSILNRGQVILWGAALPPKALNALLELSQWCPERGSTGRPGKETNRN